MPTRIPICWLLATALVTHSAHAEAPVVSRVVPAAVRPGESVEVTLFGQHLSGPTAWWSSFPATAELAPNVEKNGTLGDRVVYRVSVPAAASAGIGAIRVATGRGVSNLRGLMIDDLPSIAEAAAHDAIASAQPLAWPVAVDGAIEPEAGDYYRVEVRAGQRLSFEVVARRLGSPLDPLLRLLDAGGDELASADDDPAAGLDARLSYRFATAGTYYLEVRDIRYHGGDQHRYRLRVGEFPLAAAPFPAAVRKAATANVLVDDLASSEVRSLKVAMPAEPLGGRLHVAVPGASGQGSGLASLIASDLTEQLEAEPNDLPESATRCTLPGALNGRLERPRDVDAFAFEGKAGQRWRITAQARSIGSPAELFLRAAKADGSVVAEADGAGGEDLTLDVKLPADGAYCLRVEDLARRGGPGFVYRLAAVPFQAGFDLEVEAEKLDAPQSGVFVAKVVAARREYDGPITLALEGLPGATLADHVISQGKNETVLRVTLPSAAAAGQLVPLRVVGTAKIGEVEVRAVADNRSALRAAFAAEVYPPAELAGALALGVGPVFPSFFQVSAAAPPVLLQPGMSAPLKVRATRSNGFEGAVALAVESLPDGIAAKAPAIDQGKPDAAVELNLAKPLPPGRYPLRLAGSATFQHQPQRIVLAAAVQVGETQKLEVAAAGPLPLGGKQTLMLSFPDDVIPAAGQRIVNLEWRNLPAGVQAPPRATLPQGQKQVAVELVAAGQLKLGTIENLSVAASTDLGQREGVYESAPLSLKITAP